MWLLIIARVLSIYLIAALVKIPEYPRDLTMLLITTSENFDLVFSIGLIEHFDKSGTAKAIASHFQLCKPKGMVLITFPTPTLLYKLIRRMAEFARIWRFYDERPLNFEEVITECSKFGIKKHNSILWAIGLTQGYVVFEKI